MKDKSARTRSFPISGVLFSKLVEALNEDDVDAYKAVWIAANVTKGSLERDLLARSDDRGKYALHLAVANCSLWIVVDVIRRTVAVGASLDRRDWDNQWTPLHLACYEQKPVVAVHLIRNGASLTAEDPNGYQPLDFLVKDRINEVAFEPQHRRGEISIYGSNTNFQLGVQKNDSHLSLRAAVIEGMEDAIMAATAKQHSLFLGSCGRVWAVGVGQAGRLGLGDEKTRIECQVVPGISDFVTYVAVSCTRSAAVTTKGALYVWGNGVLQPTRVKAGLQNVVIRKVALADSYALASDSDGRVWAWGDNAECQLGLDYTVQHQDHPRRVMGLSELTADQVFIGHESLSAVICRSGEVYTWGKGQHKPQRVLLPLRMQTNFPRESECYRRHATRNIAKSLCFDRHGMLYALTTYGSVYSWTHGQRSAKEIVAFGKRSIASIAGSHEKLFCVDSHSAAWEFDRRKQQRASPIPGYRGAASVYAYKNHAIFIGSPRMQSSTTLQGDIGVEDLKPEGISLQQLCAGRLVEVLTVDTIFWATEAALLLSNQPLFVSCIRFITSNLDAVVCAAAANYQHIPRRALQAIDGFIGSSLSWEECAWTSGGKNHASSLDQLMACKPSDLSSKTRRKLGEMEELLSSFDWPVEHAGPLKYLTDLRLEIASNEDSKATLTSNSARADSSIDSEATAATVDRSPPLGSQAVEAAEAQSLKVNEVSAEFPSAATRSVGRRKRRKATRKDAKHSQRQIETIATPAGEKQPHEETAAGSHLGGTTKPLSTPVWRRRGDKEWPEAENTTSSNQAAFGAVKEVQVEQSPCPPDSATHLTSTIYSREASSARQSWIHASTSSTPVPFPISQCSSPSSSSAATSSCLRLSLKPSLATSPTSVRDLNFDRATPGTGPRGKGEKGSGKRNRKYVTLLQVGGSPSARPVEKQSPAVSLTSSQELAVQEPPRGNPWGPSSPTEVTTQSSNSKFPGLLSIQEAEKARKVKSNNQRCTNRGKTKTIVSTENSDDETHSLATFVQQTVRRSSSAPKTPPKTTPQWGQTGAKSRPSLAEIQLEEEREKLRYRNTPQSQCWTLPLAEKPVQAKSLRKIETEERALKGFQALFPGMEVRRVANNQD